MTGMWDRLLRGELHRPDHPELAAAHAHAQQLLDRFDATAAHQHVERDAVLRQLLRYVGAGVVVRRGFRCEYGSPVFGSKP